MFNLLLSHYPKFIFHLQCIRSRGDILYPVNLFIPCLFWILCNLCFDRTSSFEGDSANIIMPFSYRSTRVMVWLNLWSIWQFNKNPRQSQWDIWTYSILFRIFFRKYRNYNAKSWWIYSVSSSYCWLNGTMMQSIGIMMQFLWRR